jgi:folate-binding protein YgfZ
MSPTVAVVDRSPRGLVRVHGPDATSYLQSLVSQDLDGVSVGEGVHSLLLTPQGKLDVDLRALRVGDDEWWLDTDAAYGPRLAESLNRFRIRVEAEVDDLTAESGMVTMIGAAPDGGPETAYAHRALDGLRVVYAPWGDERAFDVLGPRAAADQWLGDVDPSVERWSGEQLESFRIEHGVPKLGVDVDEKTIPQEAFLERDAVSFTKGCFLGQELVCRIDSRGHVNRLLRKVRADADVPAGASVVVGDKEVGAITSVARASDGAGTVALATVRREVEVPGDATLRWDGGETPARLDPVPTPV